MVFDRNKNGWMEVSIAMVAVMLIRTCSGRAHAMDDSGNSNHTYTNSRVKNMVENKAYGGHVLRILVGIMISAILVVGGVETTHLEEWNITVGGKESKYE